MSDHYCCDGAVMQELENQLQTVEEEMEDAYQKALSVKDKIDSQEGWKSDSQKTMAAFLDLLTQYHKDFIQGEKAPLDLGIEHLQELQTNLGNFYEDWEEYQTVKKIN